MEEIDVDIFHLAKRAGSIGAMMSSVPFRETILMEVLCSGTSECVLMKCNDRLLKKETPMNSVVQRIVLSATIIGGAS